MRVLVTGGGTAGHINPALAIADIIKKEYPDTTFLFVGAEGKMETELVPKAGYPITTVKVKGFYRSFSPAAIKHNIGAAVNVLTATHTSANILKTFKPDLCIGTGGYVCGPILRKALKMHIPVLVHESNAFPGVTVKMLAKDGATVLLCSEAARKHLPQNSKIIITGNPLRPAFATMHTAEAKANARKELGVDDRPLVVSFGGSLGAQYINEAMIEVLSRSHADGKLQHIHGVGKGGWETVSATLKEKNVPLSADGISVRPYIDNMPTCMAAADLIISRCGAMTLSEIPAAGKPSILIPSPYVAENHQYHNAMALVNQGAAVCIEEKDLTADRLWDAILEITADPNRMQQMAQNAAALAIRDADARILAAIKDVL